MSILAYVVMKMKMDDLAERLLTDLRPYIQKLSLKGFSGMCVIDLPEAKFNARVVNGRVELNRRYFLEKAKLALQGDSVAYSDLLNTFHHELCHIDIDNRMPFLSRPLSDEEVFPRGIAFRFTREYLACSGSVKTMSAASLKEQISNGAQEIKALSEKRDIKNYSDVVCDLSYLVGNCSHAPCGYFVSMCNAIDDEILVALARHFLDTMTDFENHLPFVTEEDISPLCDAIMVGWRHFNKWGG